MFRCGYSGIAIYIDLMVRRLASKTESCSGVAWHMDIVAVTIFNYAESEMFWQWSDG